MANTALGPLVGGSFAPAIGPEELSEYAACIEKCKKDPKLAEVGEWMAKLHNLTDQFLKVKIPAKTATGKHQTGQAWICPLDDKVKKTLDEHQPWKRELEMLSNAKADGLFDTIEDKEVREAAMHLLWYAWELELGREPLTQEKTEQV